MALVAAICSQCGAQIKVDDSQDAGICEHCGTAFVTEKVIKNYHTHIINNNSFAGATINVTNGSIDNLIQLSQNAISVGNYKECLKYCDKALEIDAKNSDAWFLKMQGEEFRLRNAEKTIENSKAIEGILNAARNAIEFESETNKETRISSVHLKLLEIVKMQLLSTQLSLSRDNIETISQLARINKQAALNTDQIFILGITLRFVNIIDLLNDFNQDEVSKSKEMQNLLKECIDCLVDAREEYVKRLLIYGVQPDANAVSAQKSSEYDRLVALLPDEEKENVKKWTIEFKSISNNTSTTGSGACYVATAIYGSYDCPEVWTLRRFRDYTLAKNWYGRAFIKIYYLISPTFVKWLGNTEWFKKMSREKLNRLIKHLQDNGYASTPYEDKEC
ncbi:hypothetical protein D6853_05005 [Butyrivibrio sp. X503]|uniref:CFI-box-CTERM domain-containing protein n=1 Tax=Butyrivibrio sp. X503 TaxID=2364878 RepID=UPI000EAA3691|nr:CFI-box-CTERM domain-containing protein [Butyrivibrio sp. X503]RKM57374.1 hypothetical protein D6853_05005 [Butyrivibrio sp. X503]